MANEKRLIDANALKARFKLRIDWLARDAHDEYTTGLFHGAETDVELIDEIPTVDAVEVVHGAWVNVIHAVVDTTGYCTRCGEQAVWRTRNKPYAICPNCGANMMDLKGE